MNQGTSLLEKLKAGKRNVRLCPFPGTEESVAVRVLSNQEIQDSVFAAERLFDKAEIPIRTSSVDAYEDERSTQILWRALRDPDDADKPFAATVSELRSLITREEKETLMRLYDEFQEECSPNFTRMNDGDFEALWDVVKKNPRTLSNVSNSGTLKGLLLYLASRPPSSPTDSGSIS